MLLIAAKIAIMCATDVRKEAGEMTREELLPVLAIIRTNYRLQFRDMSKDEANDMLNLWAIAFSNDDAEVIRAAVWSYMNAKNDFAPKIGDIREIANRLVGGDELTEGSAWNMVAKAIKNGIYGSAEEFAKLPKEVQRIVGSPNQLRDWAEMETDTVNSVVASNFQRAFRRYQESRNNYEAIPMPIRLRLEKSYGAIG